jgi:hypothetical protein
VLAEEFAQEAGEWRDTTPASLGRARDQATTYLAQRLNHIHGPGEQIQA